LRLACVLARTLAPAAHAASQAEARAIVALSQTLDAWLERAAETPPMSLQARLIAAERVVDQWLDRQEHRLRQAPVMAQSLAAQLRRGGVRRTAGPYGLAALATLRRQVHQALGAREGAPVERVTAPRPVLAGVAGITAAGVLLAAFAPVEHLAIGAGVLTDGGAIEAISHPEGGVVAQVAVRPGQVVRAGDLLLQLEPMAAKGNVQGLRLRAARLAMAKARLTALMDGAAEPAFSSDADLDPRRARAERAAFALERRNLRRDLSPLDRRIARVRAEIDRAGRELEALSIERSRLLGVRDADLAPRGVLPIDTSLGHLDSRLALVARSQEASRAALAQAETERAERLAERRRGWALELSDVAAQLDLLDADLLRLADRGGDFEIRASFGGRVQWVHPGGPGARVGASEKLVRILPSDAALTASVCVRAVEARRVRPGDAARVLLAPAMAGDRPVKVAGMVTEVSTALGCPSAGPGYRRVLVSITPAGDAASYPWGAVRLDAGVRAEIVVSDAATLSPFAQLFSSAAMAGEAR
jgi:multidrug resistance efflux pump